MQAGEGLQLLLIDNMSAFYWQDRAVHQAVADRVPQRYGILTVSSPRHHVGASGTWAGGQSATWAHPGPHRHRDGAAQAASAPPPGHCGDLP